MQRSNPTSILRTGHARLHAFVALALVLVAKPLAAEPEQAVPAESPVQAEGSGQPASDKATKKIPSRLVKQVLGCWQLDGQERWVITRLDLNGAQVVTKLLKNKGHASFPDYVRRAAIPATLMYDAHEGNFGFSVAGRIHPTLVLFKTSGSGLEATLYTKHSPKDRFTPTGNKATLQRCRAAARSRPAKSSPPPRLE